MLHFIVFKLLFQYFPSQFDLYKSLCTFLVIKIHLSSLYNFLWNQAGGFHFAYFFKNVINSSCQHPFTDLTKKVGGISKWTFGSTVWFIPCMISLMASSKNGGQKCIWVQHSCFDKVTFCESSLFSPRVIQFLPINFNQFMCVCMRACICVFPVNVTNLYWVPLVFFCQQVLTLRNSYCIWLSCSMEREIQRWLFLAVCF